MGFLCTIRLGKETYIICGDNCVKCNLARFVSPTILNGGYRIFGEKASSRAKSKMPAYLKIILLYLRIPCSSFDDFDVDSPHARIFQNEAGTAHNSVRFITS